MPTFKKKDIKKVKLDELVDGDGTFIGGDKSYETTSQISTAPAQTMDKFVTTARQRYRWPYVYGGTPYSSGNRIAGMEDFDDNINGDDEMLDEATLRAQKMVEDIIQKQKQQKGFVSKNNITDINRNKIPDIDELSTRFNKHNISSNLQSLIKGINSESLSGEEKAIILSYLISNIGMNDIEPDYKNILKSKI